MNTTTFQFGVACSSCSSMYRPKVNLDPDSSLFQTQMHCACGAYMVITINPDGEAVWMHNCILDDELKIMIAKHGQVRTP